MKGVFDTNILIDYLRGIEEARKEILSFDIKCISIISYIETLVGVNDPALADGVKKFLSSFQIVNVDQYIADLAISARKKYKLKIPDAIILATAQRSGAILVTRNTKDFIMDIPIIRVPYILNHT